jgi:spore coat protein CotH
MDRWVLAEPLAYEVYRRAGNAACRTDFVRTWIDDRPIGYQLQIEVVNKAFLKHNKVNNDGNLYKLNWFGGSVAGTHEKKTHVKGGHDDLLKVIDLLEKTKGDEQWAVIKKNFDVEQFINYFAVNMVLSHWDGYFNNHYVYNDIKGKGKWTIYPWDQDKTWGYHDGIRGYDVFFDMPTTLGMAGDLPPGYPKGKAPPKLFDYNYSIWWRPGGVFAKPLLANPHFRKVYLARAKELLETVYTEKVFFPLIDQMGERLTDEVKLRAELKRQDAKFAAEHLKRNLESLKEHLTKRREFLLKQDEIRDAGKFGRGLLK